MRYMFFLVVLLGSTFLFSSQTHAAPCHEIDSTQGSVFTGFGLPYSVTSQTRHLLLSLDCDGNDVTVTAGSGDQSEYIYELGYEWTGSTWQQIDFDGSNKVSAWFIGDADATIALQPNAQSEIIVAFICTWTGSAWKCGCTDLSCSGTSWMLQTYSAPQPQATTTPPSSSGSSSGSGTHSDAILEQLAQDIHTLTNVERVQAGLPAWEYDDDLSDIAIGHSEDMAARNFFSHTSPDGCTFTCRFEQANYQAQFWGENVAFIEAHDTQGLAERFVDNWIGSPGHRQNILSTNYTHEGIGIAAINIGHFIRYYVTSNFAQPR